MMWNFWRFFYVSCSRRQLEELVWVHGDGKSEFSFSMMSSVSIQVKQKKLDFQNIPHLIKRHFIHPFFLYDRGCFTPSQKNEK